MYILNPRSLDTFCSYRWYVPLTYVTSRNPHKQHTVWMKKENGEWGLEIGWKSLRYNDVALFRESHHVISARSKPEVGECCNG